MKIHTIFLPKKIKITAVIQYFYWLMKGDTLMTKPLLYRRRFIPDELIHLKDDTILVMEPNLIITKWNTLHPRKDIARGISAFYLDKGFKISKVFNLQGEVVYWYCDIIKFKKDDEKNTVIIEDLLIDLILYEDGSMRYRGEI